MFLCRHLRWQNKSPSPPGVIYSSYHLASSIADNCSEPVPWVPPSGLPPGPNIIWSASTVSTAGASSNVRVWAEAEFLESSRRKETTSFSSSSDRFLRRSRLKLWSMRHSCFRRLHREHGSDVGLVMVERSHRSFCCLHSLHALRFLLPFRIARSVSAGGVGSALCESLPCCIGPSVADRVEYGWPWVARGLVWCRREEIERWQHDGSIFIFKDGGRVQIQGGGCWHPFWFSFSSLLLCTGGCSRLMDPRKNIRRGFTVNCKPVWHAYSFTTWWGMDTFCWVHHEFRASVRRLVIRILTLSGQERFPLRTAFCNRLFITFYRRQKLYECWLVFLKPELNFFPIGGFNLGKCIFICISDYESRDLQTRLGHSVSEALIWRAFQTSDSDLLGPYIWISAPRDAGVYFLVVDRCEDKKLIAAFICLIVLGAAF